MAIFCSREFPEIGKKSKNVVFRIFDDKHFKIKMGYVGGKMEVRINKLENAKIEIHLVPPLISRLINANK